MARARQQQSREAYLVRLGARIRAAREGRNLSVSDAAERAEVSDVTWYKWEAGENWPNVLAVSRALEQPDPLADWPR